MNVSRTNPSRLRRTTADIDGREFVIIGVQSIDVIVLLNIPTGQRGFALAVRRPAPPRAPGAPRHPWSWLRARIEHANDLQVGLEACSSEAEQTRLKAA